MSIGNTKDQGNKGNNFPYQLRTLQLLGSINDGIAALPGVDYETRTSTYQAIANGPGYSTGDILIRYDIIDVATSSVISIVWFNDTLQTTIAPPAPGDITPVSSPSGVTVLNGPAGAAVNIQDGGNSITVDATDLDIRDLTYISDSVTSYQGGIWTIDSITNPVIVTATALDIRSLTFATDSVDVSNSTNVGVTNANLDVALSTLATELTLTDVKNNVTSKIERIKGSANYNRAITYIDPGTGDFRVLTVVHTGTTLIGAETITETFTYYLATDNVTNIQYT